MARRQTARYLRFAPPATMVRPGYLFIDAFLASAFSARRNWFWIIAGGRDL